MNEASPIGAPLTRRNLGAAALACLGAAVAPAALSGCSSGSGGENTVTVGSKDFTEGEILSEVYALALEDAGFTVERSFDIAGSVIATAIENDEIDLYPEYTGTALLTVLGEPMETDPEAAYETVKELYRERLDLEVLDMAAAADAQGLVITTSAAQSYGIATISDLQKHATELRFASQGDFDEREDGMPALEETYGPFDWKEHAVFDGSLKYEVLRNGEADVAPAYTTEGQLADDFFTLLEDDKHVWPPYNVIPVVRASVLEAHPGIADALNAVSAKLDTQTLTRLNAQVDIDKEDFEDVASAFYESIR